MGKPRKPQNRGDVYSRTPLRLRERVAAVRCHMAEHPKRWTSLATVPLVLTVEHYQSTFPAIAAFSVQAYAVASGLVA